MKKIPKHVRCHKQTALERAKSTLLLASLPKSLPCRDKYVRISALKFDVHYLNSLVMVPAFTQRNVGDKYIPQGCYH